MYNVEDLKQVVLGYEPTVKISIVVAVARNNVIGHQGKLPWHIPEELKYFRKLTIGKPVIMGRDTFRSIGKPLPNRTNIVLSRDDGFKPSGVIVAENIRNAVTIAVDRAIPDEVDEVMVIGGETVYRQVLPIADRIYLTKVEVDPEGDTWFPFIEENRWTLTVLDNYPSTAERNFAYSTNLLERK